MSVHPFSSISQPGRVLNVSFRPLGQNGSRSSWRAPHSSPPHRLAAWRLAPACLLHECHLSVHDFRALHFHQPPGTKVALSAAGDWNWAAGRAAPLVFYILQFICLCFLFSSNFSEDKYLLKIQLTDRSAFRTPFLRLSTVDLC